MSPIPFRPRLAVAVASLAAALLSACGGGDGGPAAGSADTPSAASRPTALAAVTPPSGPGTPKDLSLIGVTSVEQMAAVLATVPALGLQPRYAVANYRLTYVTLDGEGREVVASGLAAVPLKPAGSRSPVMSWQHGTLFEDRRVPSNNASAEEPATLLASQGYIVLAADYVGYGASKGVPHPYLMSAPTAAAVIDLLTAGRTLRQRHGVLDNGQLFMAGYSEGGYATMAALRAMEAGGSPHLAGLVGIAPGAGPYSVTATMDGLLAQVRERNDLLRLVAWPGILRSLNEDTRAVLRTLLLREAIPPEADVSFMAPFIDLYLSDDSAALDSLSNVHDWRSSVPVLMHHGRDDRTVAHGVAAQALSAMSARGSPAVSLTECDAQPAGHLECVVPYFRFMLSAAAGAARDL